MKSKTHYIFHITPLENLGLILKSKQLFSKRKLEKKGCLYSSPSHPCIQDRRSDTKVSISPWGTLHDYVPFYFAPRSPMLYAIHKGQVKDYKNGQGSIIYLVTSAEQIKSADCSFVFTDGHAVMEPLRFYNDLAELKRIDWGLMKEHYWNNTEEDPDRKRRRQAEFLVYGEVPARLIKGIGVYDVEAKNKVNERLLNFSSELPVLIRGSWYY